MFRALALALSIAACGNDPGDLAAVDMLVEQQRLQESYPEAVGFAFVDPLNSGMVLNKDGTGTYIRNPGSDPVTGKMRPFEYVPVTIQGVTGQEVCFSNGCMSLSRRPNGALYCEIRWNNGNVWPHHTCKMRPILPGFDVKSLNRPVL